MAEESEQEMKALKLNGEIESTIKSGVLTIQKVIGGWIYWRTHNNAVETNEGVSVSCALAGVFVP